LTIKGPIGPAVSDYVHRGLAKASERGAAAVVLQIDTPGGLDTSMREIVQDILSSPVPVIGYVAPSGARAASAGTYILYATHVAAMAPGTNLGAATPVQIGGTMPFSPPAAEDDKEPGSADGKPEKNGSPAEGGEEAETGKAKDEADSLAPAHPTIADKALQDAIAYLRSLAQMRGRNVDWAERAVREAASLSAEDALEEKVIDLIADNLDELLNQADGRIVTVAGQERALATAGAVIRTIDPDWRAKLLGAITNPNVAYILLVLGFYGILLVFYTGTIVSGVIGAICLILGLYGLHVLPISYAGLGLLVLGLVLLVAEALVPSFGVLGFGGVIAFVAGSIMLLDTDLPGFGISWMLIGSMAAVSAGLMLITMIMLVKSRRRAVVSGEEEMLGSTGRVVDWTNDQGRVRVHGELWQARAARPLDPGRQVRVTAIEGLTLVVEPETKGR
jgi:membrane-bound serine protease (ClpP class)